jgi:hypothetical protein
MPISMMSFRVDEIISIGDFISGFITNQTTCIMFIVKKLNPRRRVYAEIPQPSRVELKCSQNPRVLT